ncbi:DUF397 domain-containing protein [Streptomyces uncialis]|uniref:DUF397 domain-containing protein n=1 Tax=Streptomyces uncialis TaxID=1048205 RepID=UPI00224C9051|nr:DUF397 domain-containing protein [Streptomyces uncialis]MCX4663999.1 DUF397 domain-containing protein [Streptomyces uncialis]
MTCTRIPEHAWQASSHSGANGGECVEWALAHAAVHGVVPVRDSKVADGAVLMLAPEQWTALVNSVARREAE